MQTAVLTVVKAVDNFREGSGFINPLDTLVVDILNLHRFKHIHFPSLLEINSPPEKLQSVDRVLVHLESNDCPHDTGQHQGQDSLVVICHLEDDQYRGNRTMSRCRNDSTHPYQCVCTGGSSDRRKKVVNNTTKKCTGSSAKKE